MDRPIFNRSTVLKSKSILAISIVGMFFFSAYCRARNLELSTDLLEKQEWELCRRECMRALLSNTEPVEQFQLIEAMASVGAGINPARVVPKFKLIITTNTSPETSAIASYELGRLYWQIGQLQEALDSLAYTFQTTTNKELFLHSACSMFLLFEDHRKLRKDNEDLVSQINTSRSQWYAALFSECAKPDPHANQPQKPIWIIRFYRSQISPAIGQRCVLEPSCSEYFHQAHCKHGMASIPMIADRLCREPEVSTEKKDPVVMRSGQIRHGDPVENHDFWMKKK